MDKATRARLEVFFEHLLSYKVSEEHLEEIILAAYASQRLSAHWPGQEEAAKRLTAHLLGEGDTST